MSISSIPPRIEYPDSDGQPMADNTLQFRWIVTIKENLDVLFGSDPDVFVAGDLLWYPVKGQPKIRQAPDALVVFGRPKGYRGSYRQWEESNIPPQVVFEVLSPSNRLNELTRKFQFYERHGVEEYYVFDPDHIELYGWRRENDLLLEVPEMEGYQSPRLGIRFSVASGDLLISRPDGKPFLTFEELAQERDREARRADAAEKRAAQAEQENTRLRERLKALGDDADPTG